MPGSAAPGTQPHLDPTLTGSTDASSASRTTAIRECHGDGGTQYATFWDGLFLLGIILGRFLLLQPGFLKFLPFSGPGTVAEALRLCARPFLFSQELERAVARALHIGLRGGRGRTRIPLGVALDVSSGPDALQGWALTATWTYQSGWEVSGPVS